jgi:hypothetical protein
MYPNSYEKQYLETSERPQSEQVKEETSNDIKVETGRDPGNQSENESNDHQKLTCEQDTKINDVASPTTPLNPTEERSHESREANIKRFFETFRRTCTAA